MFLKQLGRHKGGRELLAAVGFCDELSAEAGRRSDNTDNSLAQRSVSPSNKIKTGAAAAAGGVNVGQASC